MKQLFCDCKTDEEKANFFLSGRAVETGIIASAISNDIAMAYHRCAEFKKEIKALRTKIVEMEKQEPVAWAATDETKTVVEALGMNQSRRFDSPLFLAPGAQSAPTERGIATKTLSEMFLSLDGRDKDQPGHEWRKGWNDAIRQAMDYAQPASSVPDLLESLRCACNYIDKLGGVSQQYRAMLAALPGAKGEEK